jgi:sugar (pentulose or hexulose) kinase
VRFLHGLLEGIGRIEALGYRRLADLGGPMLAAVRTVGAGARNAAWTGIRSRMLGVDLSPARSEEAAVGAAMLALRAMRQTVPAGFGAQTASNGASGR